MDLEKRDVNPVYPCTDPVNSLFIVRLIKARISTSSVCVKIMTSVDTVPDPMRLR